MARQLSRLGRFCARHHWWVLGVWVVLVVGLGVLNRTFDGQPSQALTIPGTSAQTGNEVLARDFPSGTGPTGQVVLQSPSGPMTPQQVQAVGDAVQAAQRLPGMQTVTDPYSSPAPQISADRTTAIVALAYQPGTVLKPDDLAPLQQAMQPAAAAGLEVSYAAGPAAVAEVDKPDYSELYGLVAAVVILLLVFGSLWATVTPLVTALVAVTLGTTVIEVLMAATSVPSVATTLATMIGLGVGIDYSLLVITRHRSQLASDGDLDPLDSVALAMATAGHAVVFAGLTVAVALCGLVLSGIPFVGTLGWTAAVGVVASVLAALTLLPAILGLLGRRIDSLRLPFVKEKVDDGSPDATGRYHGWARWAHHVCDHPWPYLVASVVLLAVLAMPLAGMHLGQVDAGDDPPGSTTRQAYDVTAAEFGAGSNGPIALVVTDPTPAVLTSISATAAADPDVAEVLPPETSSSGSAATITVVPRSGPKDAATEDLVRRLSGSGLASATQGSSAQVYVTGFTAEMIEFADRLGSRMPLFILAIVAISFVLLMCVFRSVLVPLKAAIMNLVSIGAAYGVVVAIFEWGWARGLIGLPETVMIVAFVPMMMFAILFGLSMDYEVFLLARISEAHQSGLPNRRAVAVGLASTARVISAAALIMVSVFLSFVTGANVVVKMMGVGLATAVLVDATVVRLVLVPATMALLGDANWWLPRWLGRILPKVDFETPPASPDVNVADPDARSAAEAASTVV